MEFILDIAEFLLQAVILLGVFLIAFAGVVAISQRRRGAAEEGTVEAKSLNERYESQQDAIRVIVEDPALLKARDKALKKEKKQKEKAAKRALKLRTEDDGEPDRPRLYVLDFDGDIQASQVDQLREEISAVLQVAKATDEVLLRLESGGGAVHGYGLAASQLVRLTDAHIKLTVSVDKVAASGGYMMACVADHIIAAPFAIIGSIGVVAQLPNFHRLLKKNDIDFEIHTAGEFKRTLTLFGENTDKAREKFQADIDDVHVMFKEFVAASRPVVPIDEVSTGEYWFGQRALEKNLVDQLCTSDAFLLERLDSADLIEVRFRAKRNWQERLGMAADTLVARAFKRLLQSEQDQRYL
ncbi:MAG: protease SohB [Luminiphilus sp.]|jgi:serine protease SohB|nr:protease SohB [Luminiphilus sp.]